MDQWQYRLSIGSVETQQKNEEQFYNFLNTLCSMRCMRFCLNVNPYLVIIHYICHLQNESHLLLVKLVQQRSMKDDVDCEVASLESKNCRSKLDLHPAACVRPKKTIMDLGVKNTYSAQLSYTVVQTNNSFKALSSY